MRALEASSDLFNRLNRQVLEVQNPEFFKILDARNKLMWKNYAFVIVSIYFFLWILIIPEFYTGDDFTNMDVLTGYESIPLIISVIAYTIANIYLNDHKPYRFLHWAWDLFFFALIAISFYGFAYNPLPDLPQKYIWAGPLFILIVNTLLIMDTIRMKRRKLASADQI